MALRGGTDRETEHVRAWPSTMSEWDKCSRELGLTQIACKNALLKFQEFCKLVFKHSHHEKLNYMNLKLNYIKDKDSNYLKLMLPISLNFAIIYALEMIRSVVSE